MASDVVGNILALSTRVASEIKALYARVLPTGGTAGQVLLKNGSNAPSWGSYSPEVTTGRPLEKSVFWAEFRNGLTFTSANNSYWHGQAVLIQSNGATETKTFPGTYTHRPSVGLLLSSTAVGSYAGLQWTPVLLQELSGATGAPTQQVEFSTTFGVLFAHVDSRWAVGLFNNVSPAVLVSTAWSNVAVNAFIGCGMEPTDANLQIISKVDGVMTKTDTGLPRASVEGGLFRLTGRQVAGTREIKITLVNLLTGATLASNISCWLQAPTSSNTNYSWSMFIGNTSTAGGTTTRELIAMRFYADCAW